MSEMDGLNALQAQRKKASSRHLPPARNAPKATSLPESTPSRTVSAPAKNTKNPTTAAQSKAVTRASPDPLVRSTIYLNSSDDKWIEEITWAGRQRQVRVDASRSAITRFALSRLRESLTTAEILDYLSSQAEAQVGETGRKRL